MARLPAGANPKIDAAIKELAKAMDQMPPDRLLVRKGAQEISRLLGERARQMEGIHFDEKKLGALYTAVTRDPENLHRDNWDNAAQIYSTLGSLEETRRSMNPRYAGHINLRWLNRMDELLGIGREDTPHIRFDSPHNYRPDSFGKALRELQQGPSK
jgi:hypothetical protein